MHKNPILQLILQLLIFASMTEDKKGYDLSRR